MGEAQPAAPYVHCLPQIFRIFFRAAKNSNITSRPSSSHSVSTTMQPSLPPEIIDEVIEHFSKDDKSDRAALFQIGQASRHTMAKSRHILFQRMEFDYDKSAFDGFLDVLDAPWTSFSAVVQHISIKRFFRGASKLENRFAYVPRSAASIRRITQNLPNLERLWVVRSSWGDFPPHILDLLFHLPVSDLQIEECSIQHISELQELFIRMPPSIRTISMYNMRESYSLRRDGYVTQDVIPFPDRNIHFETIDSVSAYFVMQLWSDLLGKGWKRSISVDTFHLRMYTSTDVSHSDIATCSRFLQIVGPSIRRLCIRLSEGSSWDRDFFTSGVDMSPCVNVSFIDIDKIQLDAGEMADICSRPNVEHLLSSVPPNQVEEMLVTFYFADYFNRIPLDDQIPYLRAFGWKTFICHLRCRFKNLRRLRIRLSGGLVKNEHGLADICLYVNVLREISELDQLERSAFLSFEGVPPTESLLTCATEIPWEGSWRERAGLYF